MPVYKNNKNGTWMVIFRYEDFTGEKKQTTKRGFKTRREAVDWEHEAMLKVQAKLDMTFESFWEIYKAEKEGRVKESTWDAKEHIVRTKILPYFGKRKIDEIKARDVIAWQNELMKHKNKQGKPYSPDYLRTIHSQLTAIFNHAVNYYRLPSNPARQAGTMGKEIPKEMKFWTMEEYLKFAEAIMDKPLAYYAFEVLYWTGIREGEFDENRDRDIAERNQSERAAAQAERAEKAGPGEQPAQGSIGRVEREVREITGRVESLAGNEREEPKRGRSDIPRTNVGIDREGKRDRKRGRDPEKHHKGRNEERVL